MSTVSQRAGPRPSVGMIQLIVGDNPAAERASGVAVPDLVNSCIPELLARPAGLRVGHGLRAPRGNSPRHAHEKNGSRMPPARWPPNRVVAGLRPPTGQSRPA